jgi:predicted porin
LSSGKVFRICRRVIFSSITGVTVYSGMAPAFGQSSVQLYGLIDEWVGAQSTPSNPRAWILGNGGLSTSYWGLKGSEDLGNAWHAIFTLEGYIRVPSGRYGTFDGDAFFSRNAYIGIESPYGTVTAGRLTTPFFISTILFNPFADSYTFSPIVTQALLGIGNFPNFTTDQGAIGPGDWNNAIQYSSPQFGGLSGSAMYALGNSASQPGAKKWSGQVLYFGGAFAATAVVQYQNFNTAPGDLDAIIKGLKSQDVAEVGASYTMKYVKLFGQYLFSSNKSSTGDWHVNTGQAGAAVPFGRGEFKASYAYSRDSGGLNQRRSTFAVGYDYTLSKRTDVYVAYLRDHISNESTGQTYGVGIRSKF